MLSITWFPLNKAARRWTRIARSKVLLDLKKLAGSIKLEIPRVLRVDFFSKNHRRFLVGLQTMHFPAISFLFGFVSELKKVSELPCAIGRVAVSRAHRQSICFSHCCTVTNIYWRKDPYQPANKWATLLQIFARKKPHDVEWYLTVLIRPVLLVEMPGRKASFGGLFQDSKRKRSRRFGVIISLCLSVYTLHIFLS